MKKEKVVKLCKKAAKCGYLTHSIIMDLYNPGEDIPDYVIGYIIHKPYPSNNHPLIMGEAGYAAWQKALNDFMKDI
jgi:hypothetical protein